MIDELKVKVLNNVEKVILGKPEEIKLALVALLCEGHILMEDVPGVGKTMLARAIALSLGCSFARIQFTPDLLPSDIIGVNLFNQKTQEFEFRPGAVNNQIVLADEINRASPKTQSALLEAMEERQTTVEGVSYPLPRPFMVIATQNPLEYEGTFFLPESQLDRFFLKVSLGYPSFEAENEMLLRQRIQHPIEELKQVVSAEELKAAQLEAKEIFIAPVLREYMVKIVQETRKPRSLLSLGASPRGSISLFKACQAFAAVNGRDYVLPDDVKAMAVPTLAHRMLAGGERRDGKALENVIFEVLDSIEVPVLEKPLG